MHVITVYRQSHHRLYIPSKGIIVLCSSKSLLDVAIHCDISQYEEVHYAPCKFIVPPIGCLYLIGSSGEHLVHAGLFLISLALVNTSYRFCFLLCMQCLYTYLITSYIITVKMHACLYWTISAGLYSVTIDNTPLNGNNVVHQFVAIYTLFVVISVTVFKFLEHIKL